MSNSFIGTKPYQVPTNNDLGRLAFLDYVGLADIGTSIPTLPSAISIAPLTQILYVSGTAAISTIGVPPLLVNGGEITIIPTGAFTITTSNNVAVTISAEVNKPLRLTYEAVAGKWYPSYSNTVNRVTITAPATSSTLTIANDKTLTVNNSLTLAGVDTKILTVNNSLTLAGADDKTLSLNASVTINTTTSNAVILDLRAGGTVAYTSDIGGSGLTPTAIKTSVSSPYTALANDLVRCDTSTAVFSVTLPVAPSDGTIIGFVDVKNTFLSNPLTVLANGKTIESDNTSFVIDVSGAYLEFLYVGLTGNWKMLQTPTLSGGIPIASPTQLGTVKVDGNTITINSSGVISAVGAGMGLGTPGIDYVVPNVATIFTKPQRPSMSAETAPTTTVITWDLTSDQIFRINLTSNITTFNLTGTLSSLVGNQYELLIRYNGGTSISWHSNMKWSNGSAPVLTGVSSKLDIITFTVATPDGTNFYLVNTGFKLNVG